MKWKALFSGNLIVLTILVLAIHTETTSAGRFHGEEKHNNGFNGKNPGKNGHKRRGFYKKHTNKSIAIGEASNLNLRKFETLIATGNDVRSAVTLLSSEVPDACKNTPKNCDVGSPYRTADGTCNNLQNPYWGSSFFSMERLLPPVYEDGFNEPRGGGKGKISRLPNPRLISTTIHPDLIKPDPILTNMVPQVGQLVDHDLTFAPENDLDCCASEKDDIDCFPIDIPPTDYFYHSGQVNQTCLPFTRSTPFCFPGPSGIREQMNSLTAFLDASMVYGSDQGRLTQLRAFQGGRLRVNLENPKLLPTVAEIRKITNNDIEIEGTFAAGDERVNEMPALTVLHTLFVREHNRLASEVQSARPNWSDEQIFQTVRRLLTAEWQKVVYGEYLPIILGRTVMAQYDLNIFPTKFSQYDPRTNPSIFQAFATAAYRFGHTLINGLIRLMHDVYQVGSYKIRDGFFQDQIIKSNGGEGYDLILTGLMQQNAQTYDAFVTEDLTNFVLRKPEDNFGQDLLARNVQRGRDHAVPGYNAYRKLCNLTPLTSWAVRPTEILETTWTKLQSLYTNPDDIDLFTGGLSELPLTGAVTGPTFNCLKAIQFQRLKKGDRFFYTHEGQAGSFTLDQIEKINARTLGDIICQNSNIQRTPKDVFQTISSSNPWLYCSDSANRKFLNIADFV